MRLNNKVYGRDRRGGRLVSLSHLTKGTTAYLQRSSEVANMVVINFPAMPDSIPLTRRSNYNVTKTYTTPDGFHIFTDVEPLEIPFSFKLHSQDEFCEQGGLTILDIAAKLHALGLPIGESKLFTKTFTSVGPPPDPNQSTGAQANAAAYPAEATQQTNVVKLQSQESDKYKIRFPVAVLLDLVFTGDDSPGIRCVGYVKDVNAVLYGPFLRTVPSMGGYNIPTWGEFSFTFVHRPSHTNADTGGGFADFHAYADDVKNLLYNTSSIGSSIEDGGTPSVGFNT